MTETAILKTRPVHLAIWLRAVLLLPPLIPAVLLPAEFADPDGSPWGLLLVFVFMAICMWPLAFATHWIEARSDGIRIIYWPLLSREFAYSAITSVDYREDVSPWEFAGIGLRLAPGGVLALVNRKGPGFGVHLDDGRTYFVILADKNELAEVQRHVSEVRPDLGVGGSSFSS